MLGHIVSHDKLPMLNPYFFMQPELETYPFSYVLHEMPTTMDSNSIRVFFCCYSVTAEKFNLLMSYMHFNNRYYQ